MELKSTDVFIDIGHGIGSVVLQAAFTRGCDSRGIELKQKRNSLATKINVDLQRQILLTEEKQNIENRNVRTCIAPHLNFFLFQAYLRLLY